MKNYSVLLNNQKTVVEQARSPEHALMKVLAKALNTNPKIQAVSVRDMKTNTFFKVEGLTISLC